MANTPYENFFLGSIVEDQFNSHLDLARFVTVDTSLQGTAGMKKIINVYSATDGTEKLTQGQGNSKSITAGFTQKEYEILLAQNRFDWYDEEAMKADLEKYGKATYEEWADVVTEEQFYIYGGEYMNVLIGKGLMTREELIELLEFYFARTDHT
jgi:hypothetical protein